MEMKFGDDGVGVTEEKLGVEDIMAKVGRDRAGGVAVFAGTTRDTFEGKKVVRLEYEAYHEMAISEMRKVCEKMRKKWDQVCAVELRHRLGEVKVGEISVVVAVAAVHRKHAIEACEFGIDEIKRCVPIWKKEVYEDGSEWKKNDKQPQVGVE